MVLFAQSAKIRAGHPETRRKPMARSRCAQLQKLSQSTQGLLDCFKSSPEKRLKVSDIQKDKGMPDRTIQYVLQTLTQKVFVQKLGQKAGTRYRLIF